VEEELTVLNPKKMKNDQTAIVSITQGEGGGAETALEHFLKGWISSKEKLLILTPKNSRIERSAIASGFPTLSLDTGKDSLPNNLSGLCKNIQNLKKINLVHGWSARTFELAWWLGRRLHIPASGTLHDHPHAFFHGRSRQVIMRFFGAKLKAIACVSKAVKLACEEAGYKNQLPVIYNGLVPNTIHRIPSDVLRIGFLGMHAEFKGFYTIAGWVHKTEHLNIVWFFYGEIASELVEPAKELVQKFPGKVRFLGRKPAEEIYAEIDILVHASNQFDSLPTVMIEAAYAGIPVIGSGMGGAREIIREGETGFIFDPKQPDKGLAYLLRLIEDQPLRTRMGKSAKDCIQKKFSVEQMASEYQSLWNRLC
jgi:glycosyltransferase involved in cell wall biosynthesis